MKSIFGLTVLFTLMACSQSSSAELDAEILSHPDPNVVQFYSDNLSRIEELRETIALDDEDVERRIDALVTLEVEYPLAAEITARSYVSDENERLALEAIQVLQGNLIMSDHHMPHDMSGASPRLRYMFEKHDASKAALRNAVADERDTVRVESASFLASLSDEQSLQIISEGAASGLYSEVEAANLYTLASDGVGEKYLQGFVGNGELEAQQTAVAYLGSNPDYQSTIRDAYFLNADAPTVLRVEAARTLSTYDVGFISYGPEITEQEGVDPALFEATMDSLIQLQKIRPILTPDQSQLLLDKTQSYIGTQQLSTEDEARFSDLTEELRTIAMQEQRLE
ncbi:MAG: hypothetical protein AAF351_12020 [Pseudomonadota bacterium]